LIYFVGNDDCDCCDYSAFEYHYEILIQSYRRVECSVHQRRICK